MSMVTIVYRLLYQVGFTPWEGMEHLPIRRQIDGLFAREEDGLRGPYGRALDIGCGSGIWSVALARRGWSVTGVDIVSKAVQRARKRAGDAAVTATFTTGSVTSLRTSGVTGYFDLAIDFNCVHDLSMADRPLVGASVTEVTRPGASLLMLAWSPARRRMGPRGASRSEIEAIYPAWMIVDETPADVNGAPAEMRDAAPRWYRLKRS